MEMKKLNVYKVTWKDTFIDLFFNGMTEYIVTDDVNKIYEQYRLKNNLKVKAVQIISLLV